MTKITSPVNNGFLQGTSVRQDWFQALSSVFKRLNTAESVTTLTEDSVTISNPPTQAEVQAIVAKMDALQNSLK